MNATKTTYKAWWRLSKRAWLIVAAASAVSLACCIEPTLPDNALWLADFRMWPRWYFIEPVIVFAFSIRWFLLYAAPPIIVEHLIFDFHSNLSLHPEPGQMAQK